MRDKEWGIGGAGCPFMMGRYTPSGNRLIFSNEKPDGRMYSGLEMIYLSPVPSPNHST
jgi:hypothetical protein